MVEIVYWSGTGNTEAMANEIEAAVKAAGADVESVRFEDTNVDDVASKDVILLGCPAMGSEELEDSVVEPFFTDLAPKLKGKKVGLFGSYGWVDGQWMREWQDRVMADGAVVAGGEGVIAQEMPDEDVLAACRNLGRILATV